MVRDIPAKAAPVASSAGDIAHDVAQDLGERAKTLVSATSAGDGASTSARSLRDYEQRRNERAQARAERQKARTG
jgi:hypothetical protein